MRGPCPRFVRVKIAVAKETRDGESRVAMVPELVGKLTGLGYDVAVEPGAGLHALITDEEYAEAGADRRRRGVRRRRPGGLGAAAGRRADPPAGAAARPRSRSCRSTRSRQTVVELRDAGVTAHAVELIPRISRAQSMDALSSQALVSGYRCAIVAAGMLRRFLPLNMTAAGTVQAAEVVVLGAGVAGLQAIATAKRLGAVVRAYDVRAAAAEEIRSMGAKSIDLDLDTLEGAGGYAREMTEDRAARQRDLLTPYIAAADALITTAAVPGRTAPMLVTREMVEQMKPGSVVVDLAAESGGNVEGSVAGEVVRIGNAQVWGGRNVPSQMPGPGVQALRPERRQPGHPDDRQGRRRATRLFSPDYADEILVRQLRHPGRPDRPRAHPRGDRGARPTPRQPEPRPSRRADDARAPSPRRAARSPLRPGGRPVTLDTGVVWLTIFVLSVFVGIEVISKVSSTLHTPADVRRQRHPRDHPARRDPGHRHHRQQPRAGRRPDRDRARLGEHGRRLRGHRPDAPDVRAQEARRPTEGRVEGGAA